MRRSNPTRSQRLLLTLALAVSATAISLPRASAEGLVAPWPFADSVSAVMEDITAPLEGPQLIAVTYGSSKPIELESLDGEDIWVTSRNGYNEVGELLEFKALPSPFGEPGDPDDPNVDPIFAPQPYFSVRAIYAFKPGTGASWDADDDGEYAVLLQRKEVLKQDGSAFPPQLLGYFDVRVSDEPQHPLPREASLTVEALPAPGLPGEPTVFTWVATLRVVYDNNKVVVSDWGELRREGRRFFVDIIAGETSDGFPGNVAGGIAGTGQFHRYPIGDLEAGEYSMVATSFEERIARTEWVVREPDPEPRPAFPTEVSIDVHPNEFAIAIFPPPPPHYVADVRLEFAEQGTVEIVSWGEVRKDGQSFVADVLAVVHPWPIDPLTGDRIPTPGVPPVFEHRYDIGSDLEPGEYRFLLTSRDRQLGGESFVVEDDGPEVPRGEVDLDVATGENWAVVRARIQFFERSWFLSDPGTVERTAAGAFVINATATRGLPIVPTDHNPSYRIPDLDPGEYHLTYQINGHPFARAAFVITDGGGGGGGGGEPPMVHEIEIHEGNASWAAEVFVILSDPGQVVLDWGEVRRDGNRFFVSITVGPGIIIDPLPGDDPNLIFRPPGIPPDFPVRLVSHVYPLGPLARGEYAFSVIDGDDVIATEKFEVRPGGDEMPPEVTVDVGDIEEPKDEAHRFGIHFSDPSGIDQSSIAEAKVWVVNELLGYRAEARQLSIAFTEDIPGSGASGRYEIDAPGGSWDVDDRGKYQIHIEADQVRDRQGNAIPRSRIGGFKVSIWPEPPSFPREAEIEIAQSASGIWAANVAIELPDELAATDDWEISWGEVRHFGHVLVAKAHYHKIGQRPVDDMREAGLIAPDEGDGTQRLSHDYRLGNLRDGRYLFVFLSNLGHFGKQRFNVGDPNEGGGDGNEPPEIEPFEAWQAAAFMPGDWAALPMLVDPGSDPDGDDRTNFEEYAFGFNPLKADSQEAPVRCELVAGERGQHLAIRYREMLAADDVVYRVLGSIDLTGWEDITERCDIIERLPAADGTVDVLACLRDALTETPFKHLRIEARPLEAVAE